MRWSLVLVCVLLLVAVSEGRKKKPSKGKKPGKKPSKPGVKGECDVGSPKLTAGNTKKYTDRGKCACWWDITRNDCACCKKGVGAMQCGFPMHKFCYKKLTRAALECATTSTHSQERATHASLTTLTRTVPGATRRVGNVSRTPSPGQTQRREAAAKQGPTRNTAHPSRVPATTSATATPMPLARRRPMLARLDSIGSANATRDGLATESSAWTATAHSAPSPASKSR